MKMANILEDMFKLEGRRECVCGQPLDVRVDPGGLRFRKPGSWKDIHRCPQCDAHLSRIKPQEGDS